MKGLRSNLTFETSIFFPQFKQRQNGISPIVHVTNVNSQASGVKNAELERSRLVTIIDETLIGISLFMSKFRR